MGGTKGSHIVLDHPELLAATGGRELFFENKDGRIVLIYPLKGRVLVGTTDLEHDMARARSCAPRRRSTTSSTWSRQVLPDIAVDRSQIVYRFSGVRPLPRPRQHRARIRVARVPHRAEQIAGGGCHRAEPRRRQVDDVPRLGRAPRRPGARAARPQPRRRSTKGVAIGGGAGYPTTDDARRVWLVSHGDEVGRARATELLERYGTRAEVYLSEIAGDEETMLEHHGGYGRLEIAWLARNERVVHLADIVLRRTSIAFTGALTAPLLDELADVVGAELGWDDERRLAEVQSTREFLAERHGVVLEAAFIAR